MSEFPELTVVIPNHNYGNWIGEAMNSVVIDQYPNKKLMIVDDGSTDNSWDIICGLASITNGENPRQDTIYQGRLLNTPVFAYKFANAGGPSRARNLGITTLWNHTHIFGFLDADDIYLPGKISKTIDIFKQDPQRIGAIYTDYDTINIENGQKTRVYKEPFDKDRLLAECIVHSACMVNKLAIHECGSYDEELRCVEDWDLWLRISEKFLIVHIPEPLMLVRVGPHNSTATVNKTIWEKCWNKVAEKTRQRRNVRS